MFELADRLQFHCILFIVRGSWCYARACARTYVPLLVAVCSPCPRFSPPVSLSLSPSLPPALPRRVFNLSFFLFYRRSQSMKTNFVTAAQMAKGVTPATFSFNLPPPPAGKSPAAFAQSFVDALVANYPAGIKPCVSFGQKNTTVYVTVPATSTQGECLSCTVTFHANPAHNLTRSPWHLFPRRRRKA